MRFLIVTASLLALVACGQQTAPAQSAAGAGQSAPTSASVPGATPKDGELVDPDTAAGRQQLRDMIGRFLDSASAEHAQGFQRDAGLPDRVEFLQLAQSPDRWQVNLNAGANYRFVGQCDMECGNIDIELFDPSGAVVASDVLPDDVPVVSYRPATAGTYTVATYLRTCTQEPCVVGVRALYQ
ncbi:MAG: hypothetical protein ACOYKM_05430 [Caulobacterales bacterium]|jgi:hypothetical protein